MSSFIDTISLLAAALHVVDLILCFLSCTEGTWSLGFFQQTNLYLENLSYIKNQQEQAEAQTKQYHQSNQQWKPVLTLFGGGRTKTQIINIGPYRGVPDALSDHSLVHLGSNFHAHGQEVPLIHSQRGTESRQRTTFLHEGHLVEPIPKGQDVPEMVPMLLREEVLKYRLLET